MSHPTPASAAGRMQQPETERGPMSFQLHGKNGDDPRVSRWNWFPTLAFLGRVGLLDDDAI